MHRSLVYLAGAALLAVAILPADAQSAPTGDWRVDRIDGSPPIAGSRVMMRFDPRGRVSGVSSCNRFGAGFSVEGERLSIGEAMLTRMACPSEIMAQERRFLELLRGASSWRIDGGRLIITTADGSTIEAAAAKF